MDFGNTLLDARQKGAQREPGHEPVPELGSGVQVPVGVRLAMRTGIES